MENGKKDEAAKTMGEVRIEDKNVVPGTDMNKTTGNTYYDLSLPNSSTVCFGPFGIL